MGCWGGWMLGWKLVAQQPVADHAQCLFGVGIDDPGGDIGLFAINHAVDAGQIEPVLIVGSRHMRDARRCCAQSFTQTRIRTRFVAWDRCRRLWTG